MELFAAPAVANAELFIHAFSLPLRSVDGKREVDACVGALID